MDDLYVRPEIIDEGSYLRVRQTRPVARAASPVIDHSIELTDTAIACNGRARYEDVYTYYRRELSAIGVGTCEEFARLLVRRQKRLSQIAHS